ncbi:MAG: hypothetical protein ACRDM0_24370 [Thermoleophilaceae bacterium]
MKPQDVRPLVPFAALRGPRERDRDSPLALLDAVDPQILITSPISPLDR